MTGVVLPIPLPSSRGWALADWLTLPLRSAPASGGAATIEAGQLDPDEMWLIDHMVVSCDSSTTTVLRLYEGSTLLDGSNSGRFDVADWPAGLLIRPSTSLVAVWTGASAGAVGELTLQARRMRRT